MFLFSISYVFMFKLWLVIDSICIECTANHKISQQQHQEDVVFAFPRDRVGDIKAMAR